jgi:hypothetical protein
MHARGTSGFAGCFHDRPGFDFTRVSVNRSLY